MAEPVGIVRTPRVIVADNSGNILATSDSGGDISVVSFRYKFDDKDPDECSIKLQTSDPLSFDKIRIERSEKLQVSWGYVDGPMTYAATVVVRDHETKYGRAQITTTLICSDLLTYLNTARSAGAGEATMVEHLKANFFNRYRVVIKDSGNKVWSMDLEKTVESHVEHYSYYDTLPIDPFEMADPGDNLKWGEQIKYVPVTKIEISGPEFWHVDADNEVRKWLEKQRGVIETNRSKLTVIRDLFKEAPKGPWYVTGRGQTLLIHNRDFINAPVRVYSYQNEPSTLLDFTAKTKYDQFEKNSITHEFYDQDNKKFYELNAYLDELFSMVSFQEKFRDKNVSESEFKEWLEEWINLMRAYEKWHSTKTPFAITEKITDQNGEVTINKFHLINKAPLYAKPINDTKFPNPPMAIQDNTRLPQPVPYFDEVAILRGFIYSRPLQYFEDRDNFISNEKRKMEMEKEEAKVIVVGDPILQSQMRVQISNVHKQHKGLYYSQKCEHIITQQGYKTELECIKVLSTNKLRIGGSLDKVVVEDGDVKSDAEKQYIKETEIFGTPIMIDVSVKGSVELKPFPTAYGGTAVFNTPEYNKLHNIQEELDDVDFITKVTALKFNTNAKIVPNVEDN